MKYLLLLTAALLAACPSAAVDDDDDTTAAPEPKFGAAFIGGDRPVPVTAPPGYDGLTPAPLVILLHGRGANPDLVEFIFGWRDVADELGAFLVVPESTTDAGGSPAWNWPLDPTEADDVGYVQLLVDTMLEQWAIDPDRVYLAGHSNGGFMAYRMACDAPERFAAILPYAGLSPVEDEDDCQPSASVSVLITHGTEDGSNPYAPTDGRLGVEDLAPLWAERAGCAPGYTEEDPRDITDAVDGDEARVWAWGECDERRSVELWALQGGGHNSPFSDGGSEQTLGWLLERRR